MGTIIVIELNITVDCNPKLFLSFVIVLAEVLFLDRCEKGFCHSVVIGCSRCGKGLLDTALFQ